MERIFKTPLIRLLTLLLASLSALGMFGQVSYYTPFHHSQLNKTDTIAPNNVTYKYLELDADCDRYTNEPGYPMLPVKYVTMSVPYNAYNFSISYGTIRKTSYTLNKKVYPCQTPTVIGDPLVFTAPNDSVYALNDYIHSEVAEIVSEGFIEGENHVVTLAIYPISYNPSENKYWFRWAVNLTVNYSLTADVTSNNSPMKYKPLFRYNQSTAVPSQVHTQSLVVNPTQENGFAIPDNIRPPLDHNREYWAPVGYEYVVITSDSLAPSFDRLIALKRQKGINAGVVTMQQIYADPLYANGDVVSGINDNAGKLRAYLTEAYRCGLRYAFLAGNRDIVPIRLAKPWTDYTHNNNPILNDNQIPTDYYFADLNSNWDKNNNGRLGEARDSIDYSYELLIGRLPCKDKKHVLNYTDKLVKYELNPGNGNTEYLGNTLTVASSTHTNISSSYLYPKLESVYNNNVVIYENGAYPNGKTVIDSINVGRPGLITFIAHGNPNEYTVNDAMGYPVTARDSMSVYLDNSIVGKGVDNISAHNYPNIVYTISCSTMPFDILVKSISEPNAYNIWPNLGEAFILDRNSGCVAYMGNTRDILTIDARKIASYIYSFFTHRIHNNICSLYLLSKKNANGVSNLSKEMNNYFGDPSIGMWIGVPSNYDNSNIAVTYNNGEATITGNNLNESYATATGSNNISTIFLTHNNDVPADNNDVITIYRRDAVPFIVPLELQNETVDDKRYIFVNTAKIGQYVSSSKPTGNFVFNYGSDYTIEAFGNVELHSGFVMNNGSSLKVITEGEVNIYGGTLNSGAELDITAKKVNFVGRFDTARGAKINIVKKDD